MEMEGLNLELVTCREIVDQMEVLVSNSMFDNGNLTQGELFGRNHVLKNTVNRLSKDLTEKNSDNKFLSQQVSFFGGLKILD